MANKKNTTNRKQAPEQSASGIEPIQITEIWDFLTKEIEGLLGAEANKEIWRVISSAGLGEAVEKICAQLFIENAKTPFAPFLRNLAAAIADPKEARFELADDANIEKLFLSWVSTNGASRVRKLIVLLWHYGLTHQEISGLTGYRENSVAKIIKRFRKEGVVGATRRNAGKTESRDLIIEQARTHLQPDEILIVDAAQITGYRKSYMLGLTGKKILWSRKEMGFVVARRSEIIERMPKRGHLLKETKES